MKKIVLMTVYNEAEFIDYAIQSCESYVEEIVVVEGAYQETIDIGGNPRSTDGTIEIIEKYKNKHDFHVIYANEKTDKDQRNIGLEFIKTRIYEGCTNCLLIIDGDEVYQPQTFTLIDKLSRNQMANGNVYASYFKSLTFVNDFNHYCEQEFPRLFKLTPQCTFINDNYMIWPDRNIGFQYPHVIKSPHIKYHHYAFCKNKDRFSMKKKWWETRFNNSGEYSWYIDKDNNIKDTNHKILTYSKKHPMIMKTHPLYDK